MKAPLELIKQGILEEDINLVKEGYILLTGEKFSETKKTKSKAKPKSKASDEDEEELIKIKPVFIASNKKVPKTSGPVKGTKKPNFFTTEANAKEKKKNSANQIYKDKRDPYKPTMVKCDSCGDKFDFKAEYPMGLVSKKSSKVCNKCSLSNVKKEE